MIEKRSKLGESQTLQQFSRDVDEIEAWISEKLQTASDESYKDPTNIQVSRAKWPLVPKAASVSGQALVKKAASAVGAPSREPFPVSLRKPAKVIPRRSARREVSLNDPM